MRALLKGYYSFNNWVKLFKRKNNILFPFLLIILKNYEMLTIKALKDYSELFCLTIKLMNISHPMENIFFRPKIRVHYLINCWSIVFKVIVTFDNILMRVTFFSYFGKTQWRKFWKEKIRFVDEKRGGMTNEIWREGKMKYDVKTMGTTHSLSVENNWYFL